MLYDDRGLKVDFFENLLNTYEKIGIKTSGGVDSSLCLYFVAKYISDLNLTKTHLIQPIMGLDQGFVYNELEGRKFVPVDNTKSYLKIIEIIRNSFPLVNILDPHIIKYSPNRELPDYSKNKYVMPFIKQLLDTGKIDIAITGTTSAPLFEDIDLGEITTQRDYSIKKYQTYKGPWATVDKKFLAYQYKKYNLMDTIYPLTSSCIVTDRKTSEPCRNCNWCDEKYWAFGSYDGAVQ